MITVAGTTGAPLEAISCRLVTPWTGAWLADVDVTLDDTKIAPSGRVVLAIGTSAFMGTVDDRASGTKGEIARLRIVGGGAGWDKPVDARAFHNDAPGGVLSSVVLAATAAEVGEELVEASPTSLGVDYVRTAGPAGRVLAGRGWYVSPQGITIVGPRLTVPMDPDVVSVIDWDPLTQRATLASDDPIAPGTVITDSRFGTVTVRDVEQTFGADGSSASAWCASAPGTTIAKALAAFAREAAGTQNARPYLYRVVTQSPVDGRCELQIVDGGSGAPSLMAISPWYGVPGASAKLAPGALVVVSFLNGDPGRPVIHAFDDLPPVEVSVVATGDVKIAAPVITLAGAVAATQLAVAGGIRPVAPAGPVLDALKAIGTALATIAAATTPPTTAAATAAQAKIDAAVNAPPTKVLA